MDEPDKIILSFEQAYTQKNLKRKNSSQLSFLKTFSKADEKTAQLLVSQNHSFLQKKFNNKNSLEWALDNPNVKILEYLIETFKHNNWTIQELSTQKKTINQNLSDICFDTNKIKHFFICYFNGINLTNLNIPSNNILVESSVRQKNRIQGEQTELPRSLDELNNNFNLNFFHLSFWQNKIKFFHTICELNFDEKDLWLDSLFKQITFVLGFPIHIDTLSSTCKTLFLPYVNLFPNIFDIYHNTIYLNFLGYEDKDKLNNHFVKYTTELFEKHFEKITNPEFFKFIANLYHNKNLNNWTSYYTFLTSNHDNCLKNQWINSINNIILHESLQSQLSMQEIKTKINKI